MNTSQKYINQRAYQLAHGYLDSAMQEAHTIDNLIRDGWTKEDAERINKKLSEIAEQLKNRSEA